MDWRHEMADSLRASMALLNEGHARARSEGRFYDLSLLAGMRTSTQTALRMLTNPLYWNTTPRVRPVLGRSAPISERQEQLLEQVKGVLTPIEWRLLWLTVGHNATLDAAGAALGLNEQEAEEVFSAMVPKVRSIQRDVLGTTLPLDEEPGNEGAPYSLPLDEGVVPEPLKVTHSVERADQKTERTVPDMAEKHPTSEEIAGAIAEVRQAIADRGRGAVGAILKMSAAADFAEPADQLLTMSLETIQDLAERILLRTFPNVTHEQVMTAHKALAGPIKRAGEHAHAGG